MAFTNRYYWMDFYIFLHLTPYFFLLYGTVVSAPLVRALALTLKILGSNLKEVLFPNYIFFLIRLESDRI